MFPIYHKNIQNDLFMNSFVLKICGGSDPTWSSDAHSDTMIMSHLSLYKYLHWLTFDSWKVLYNTVDILWTGRC
jgi:hypothetical protein